MTAAYFGLRRRTIDVDALYRRGGQYEYTRGINWIAMIALVVGVAPCVPGFLSALHAAHVAPIWTTIYDWAWFVGFGVAAAVYLAGMSLRGTAQAGKLPSQVAKSWRRVREIRHPHPPNPPPVSPDPPP